jgi:hypothetical protein
MMLLNFNISPYRSDLSNSSNALATFELPNQLVRELNDDIQCWWHAENRLDDKLKFYCQPSCESACNNDPLSSIIGVQN